MTIQYNLMEPVCQKAFNKFYASETPTELSLKISPSCHTLSKNLDISKKRHKIQQKGMHQRLNIYYEQWTIAVLHRNHWLENQIDQLRVICVLQEGSLSSLMFR